MIYPLLPVFLSSVLVAGKVFIGLVEAVAESTASLFKIASGFISDKIGKRKLLIGTGYGLSTLAKPFFALAASPWHVLVVRFMDRVGKGIRTAPRDAIIADSSPREDWGKSYGFHRAMDTAGAIIGPLIAFIILSLIGEKYRIIFLLSSLPAIIAVLLIIGLVKEKKAEAPFSPEKVSQPPKLSLSSFSPSFKIFILITLVFTLGNSSDAFLILRAQDLGVALKHISLLWLTFNLVYTGASIPAGILSDRIGRKKVIIGGFLVYALVYFGFAFAIDRRSMWVLFPLYGLYSGITVGVMRAYVADLVPARFRGSAFGIYHMAVGITAFPASLVMGVLWQFLGPAAAFSFVAILALLAALLMMALRGFEG